MTQNFLPTPVSTLTPDALDAAKIQRRQMLAEALLQQSAVPINPQRMSGRFMSAVSPIEGIAKLAEAYIGTQERKKAETDMQSLAQNRTKRLIDMLMGTTPQQPGQDSPMGPPYGDEGVSTQDRYSAAFRAPGRSALEVDLVNEPMGVTARKTTVRPPQEQAGGALPDGLRSMAAQWLAAGVPPDSVMQMMMGLQLDEYKRNTTPLTLSEGQIVYDPVTKNPIIRGPQKYRAPLFVESGAGTDAQGRPLEVRKIYNQDTNRAEDIPGVAPVTKGPLATSTATANIAGKSVLTGLGDAAAKMIESVNAAAQGAPKAIDTVHTIRRALDTNKVSSGPGTTLGMSLKQIAQSMGYGVDQDALNKTREVITGLAELTLSSRKELQGQGQITEKETALLERARSGDIDRLSNGEIRVILDTVEKTQRYWLKRNREVLEQAKKNPAAAEALPYLEVKEPPEYGAGSDSGGFKVRR